MPSRSLEIKIIGDASGLFRTLGKSGKELRKFGAAADSSSKHTSRLATATHAFKIAGLASIPVIGLAVYQLHSMVQEAADAQTATNRLRQALDVGGISYKKYGAHIDELLTKESVLSGFTKIDLTNSYAVFARATGSVTAATKLQIDAMDLARLKGEDLATAQQTLITIQAGSYRSLKTLGIQYTAVTPNLDRLKATVKNYTKAQEDAAKKEDLSANKVRVLALLHQRLKGSMRDYGRTAQGALDKLNAAWDEMKVKIGTALLPAITRLATEVGNYLSKASTQRKINQLVHRTGVVINTEVIPALQQVGGIAKEILNIFQDIAAIWNAGPTWSGLVGLGGHPHAPATGTKGTGRYGQVPKASGGPVFPGRSYTVGEEGIEALTLFPGGGGYVTPNRGGRGNGGGLTINNTQKFYGSSRDPRAMQTEAMWAIRRLLPHAVG